MREKTCFIIGYIILGIGTLLSCYIYFWWMFLRPLLLAARAFVDGTFTWMTAVSVFVHIFVGWIPAGIPTGIAFLLAVIIMNYGADYEK